MKIEGILDRMWQSQSEELEPARSQRIRLFRETDRLSYADVLTHWQQDESFRDFFLSLLANAPFSAFRWETPPVTATTVDRPFECVLLDCPALARPVDPKAFVNYFASAAGQDVVAFPNLGGDAHLIVPCPGEPPEAYGHLAAFVRHAPEAQKHALWSLVGRTMCEQLATEPIWLSTAGMGVAWLHVRLDCRPKYYGHRPYQIIR